MKKYNIDIDRVKKNIYISTLNFKGKNPDGDLINFTNYYMELNGKPFFGISGEFHFSRYPCKYWEDEIIKIKMSGVNIISTYAFWIHHEEEEGKFDWSANNNLRYFIELCAKHKLFVFLRIGPFAHGECRNGGLPDWLYGRPFKVRSNDKEYLYYVRRFYEQIYNRVFDFFYKDGGPIIGIQLENEYMHAGAPWEITVNHGDEFVNKGKDGETHLKILKKIACEIGFDVPVYTVTGWGGAAILLDETLPLYGGYAFRPWNIDENHPEQSPTNEFIFKDYHNDNCRYLDFDPPYKPTKYPYVCCEIGCGMQVWYKSRFIVPVESVLALTIQKVAGGCNFVGYYVFHGGTQFQGKHSFLNEHVVPKISYDFQSPIGEYGQVRDSYKSLKLMFLFFKEFEELLCPMATYLPEGANNIKPLDIEDLRFAIRSNGFNGFLFINNYQDHVEMVDHQDVKININFPEERIIFPNKSSLNIKKNISAIFPFNFEMEGINLKYSTTQLITKIIDEQSAVYFFFEPEGVTGEYCFDSANIKNIDVTDCKVERSDSKIYVYPVPGKKCIINLTNNKDVKVTILTLLFREALGLYKVKLWGRDRIIISNSNIIVKNENISIFDIGNTEIEFSIYPKIEEKLYVSNNIINCDKEGVLSVYKISLAPKIINLEFKKIDNQKAIIKIPNDAFDEINDIYLYIDYEGDIGNAFIDGRLINDNFYNGTIWEIGLKRFYPEILNKEMYFYIVPVKKGKVITIDSAMALKKDFSGEQIADIYSIKVVPEYKIDVYK